MILSKIATNHYHTQGLSALHGTDERTIESTDKLKRLMKIKEATIKTPSSEKLTSEHFPIAGFVASAGGLEAFTTLLQYLEPDLGMAYVLIMHQSSDHDSSLRQVLQINTKMKVHTVRDGMKIRPDNVYVVPPNTLISLVDGHLRLASHTIRSIDNFVVDYFLISLASTYKNNSIGIILSGNATDGTLGLNAIRAQGGITFAQDDNAKFAGMAKNPHHSGYADFVLSPEGIAKKLALLVKSPYAKLSSDKIDKWHKQELNRRNIALKEAQDYANAIVQTVNSPFLVLTSNLQVKSANRSFYNTFKLTPEETEGRCIYEIGERAWDIPVFRKNLNDLIEKKTDYLEFEVNHFFPGIGEFVFIVNTYRLPSDDIKKEFLILLAFANITEVIKANRELEYLHRHLAEFTFGASHDLQEPLRKIQTFTNIIANYENNNVYIKKYIDKIATTAERMSMLMKGMLEYSALFKNKRAKFEVVDLNVTVSNIVNDLELLVDEKKATLNIQRLSEIEGAPILIYQLFYNIIKNALKFNEGKPLIKITEEKVSPEAYEKYKLKKDKNYNCITVKDNGVGFDQQYAELIFSMYKRLGDKADIKGSGMGLAICKKIIEEHGGAIFAVGQKNVGATFSVILPVPEFHLTKASSVH